jgi:hypothetical protein
MPRDLQQELKPGVARAYARAQRALWVVMAAVIVFALIGFLGSGPVARVTESADGDGLAVDLRYNRFARLKSDQRMEITVRREDASPATLSLELSGTFAGRTRIESVTPPPSEAMPQEGPVFEWQVDDWSRPVVITIEYFITNWPRGGGSIVVAVEGDEHRIDFGTLVLP